MSMPTTLPKRTRVYRCHHLDSTRWDDLIPRPDDIVITTSLKAGTTWTQRIVSLLVFQSVELPMTLHFCSPWVDSRFVGGRTELLMICEALEHRRFFKCHLPLDALPYREATKMKRDSHILGPEMGMIFEGGADGFLFKGTNGRWRDVLVDEDLELYEVAAARTLTPELKRWLELGAASGVVPTASR